MNINLKKVISSVAALAMSLSCFTAFAADFSDVEATASYKNAIDELVALEVVNGYEDGTFKPEAEITRAEVTKMVVAAMGPSYTAAAESSVGASEFSDVVNHWAAGYISVGVAQKFINGMGDGTFAPDANVTYAQIVKMLVAALGYTSAAEIAGGYPNGYIQTANQIGVTAGVAGVSADTNVTRAQVAQLISNALDTPLVVVTNWTTNILTGEPVAETKIMDGEEGRAYKTLLTEYHDAFKVKGRVTNTKATLPTIKAGKVEFCVEVADNFDKASYEAEKDSAEYSSGVLLPGEDGLKDSSVAYISPNFGETNAEELLYTYSEAIVQINEDDEYDLLTIVPYGKNEVLEFAAKDYASQDTDEISFRVSSTSSKSKAYKLDSNAKIFVNGINAGSVSSAISTYISGNKIGKVTLIDTPAAGSTSKDGKYDYIMVTVQRWATVDYTTTANSELRIYLNETEVGSMGSIIIDTENEDLIYSFTKNGEAVDFEEIKTDDVLLVTYDVLANSASGRINDSDFVAIDVCDTVVEGKIVGERTEDGVKIYTVNGAEYKYAQGGTLDVSDDYTLRLDSYGRIITADKLASSVNYAIVDRVYENTAGDQTVRLIKADGTREAFPVSKTSVFTDAQTLAYSPDNTNSPADADSDPDLKPIKDRAVTYKVNSAGEIMEILTAGAAATGAVVTNDYNENTVKIGQVAMNDSTKILDFTKVGDTNNVEVSKVKVGSLSTFVDGEAYGVLAFDRDTDTLCYQFVVVLTGNHLITPTTNFAVVNGVNSLSHDDGTIRAQVELFTADGETATPFVGDENLAYATVAANYAKGDVVAVGFNAEGEIETMYKVYDAIQDDADDASGVATANDFFTHGLVTMAGKTKAYDPSVKFGDRVASDDPGYAAQLSPLYIKSGVPVWDNSTFENNNYARVGFGILTNRNSEKSVSIALARTGVTDTGITSAQYVSNIDTDIEVFSLAADVNVYAFDLSERASSDLRLTAGGVGLLEKTPLGDSNKYGANKDYYNWSDLHDNKQIEPNYVFYKTVDDIITDIMIIKGNSSNDR